MRQCWCGNQEFSDYSQDYSLCPCCKTLVSKEEYQEKIYLVSDEKQDLYGKNYWEQLMTKEAEVESLDDIIDLYLEGRSLYWLKYILKYISYHDEVAEVGCGLGQLSYLLKLCGLQQTAFELSPEICEFVKKNLFINVECGQLQGTDKQYGSIIAIDLVEHLTKPREFLNTCKSYLKDKGILCIQMPCYDPELSYVQMLDEKPNFEKLLVRNQHVFIYSRDSAIKLLRESGFNDIKFEPAYFGDDYDMFFFASKSCVEMRQPEQIESYLKSVCPAGWMIKTLMSLKAETQKKSTELSQVNADRKQQLSDIEKLTKLIHDKEQQIEILDSNCNERLKLIETLDSELRECKNENSMYLHEVNRMCEEKNALLQTIDKQGEEKNALLETVDKQDEELSVYKDVIEELKTHKSKTNNKIMKKFNLI